MSLKPFPVTFYVYAESDSETRDLQTALNQFVRSQLSNGGLVTASKLKDAMECFQGSYMVKQYFRNDL